MPENTGDKEAHLVEGGPTNAQSPKSAPVEMSAPKIPRTPKWLDQVKIAINEGYQLASDEELMFPAQRVFPKGYKHINYNATTDEKQIADLIRRGILRRGEDEGEDIGMNCLPAPESPYTFR